jgi:Tfp pilus assembly protein PilF
VPLVLLASACGAGASNEVTAKMDTMRDEQSPDKLLERGKAFASVGDWTRAEQYLASAMDSGADPRLVMPILLHVCVEDRRYRVAAGYAEDYLRTHPSDVEMRYVLGTIDAALGDVKGARANLEAVIAVHPADPETHFALAVVLRDAKQDLPQMDHHFREYLRLAPNGAHVDEARAGLLMEVPHAPQAAQ